MTDASMKNCRICPRECGADRIAGRFGICRAPAEILVARAALHAWEEPVISGKNGSGAVFFSGCSLGCIYCQNYAISGTGGRGLPGIPVSIQELADIFLRLQEKERANNINLVTATHYIPQVAEALRRAKERGLRIPVIYNTGGYEKVSSLRMLEGLADVYLPDFKYITPSLAQEYSHAPDYPDRAKEALKEMVRQTGEPVFGPEMEYEKAGGRGTESRRTAGKTGEDPELCRGNNCLIRKGVIVRNLLLPGHVEESKKIVRYLHETYGSRVYISLMNQYTPTGAMRGDPLFGRKVTKREYERLVDYALEIGVEHGFIQEGKTAEESFIPAWNGEGVR